MKLTTKSLIGGLMFINSVWGIFASEPLYYDLEGKEISATAVLTANPRETSTKDGITRVINVTQPVLQIFHAPKQTPENKKGTLLIFPGGGYGILAINHEGTELARYLNARGYDAVILEYTLKQKFAPPLADAMRAWKILRENPVKFGVSAAEWSVLGFSAGGHLATGLWLEIAAMNSRMGTDTTNQQLPLPQNLILIYPAYLATYAARLTVPLPTDKTRLFITLAQADKAEWLNATQQFAEIWQNNGGQVNVYAATAEHGFGMREGKWLTKLTDFLAPEKTP